jgi:NADPH:quinone reductase
MTRILFHQHGDASVLQVGAVEDLTPAADELLIRHTAIGLNFIDTYHRAGLYPVALPSGLGIEAVGVVESVGANVAQFHPGDRVAYAWGPMGAYATQRTISADRVVKVPLGLDDRIIAAALLKGCTAEFLSERCAQPMAGDTVLVHAAAGGVGLLLCQWLASKGVTVIGTVGSEEKAALAKAHGCAHTILYRTQAVAQTVKDITEGRGVAIVYDSVGKDTFEASLDSLRVRGLLVSYGNASGPVSGVNLGVLAQKGSLYVTRPTLFTYYASAEERSDGTRRLFEKLQSGAIHVRIDQTYPLADAAKAHRDLETRNTTGSSILLPQ